MAAVRGLVDPVARELTGQRAAEGRGLPRDPGEGHLDARAAAGPLPLEQRGENPGHDRERAGEVGEGEGRRVRRGRRKRADPAQVVQVVASARIVAAVAAQRAVDGSLRHVVGPDAQARGDAGAEAFEDDVGAGAQRPAELRLGLQVADDRLLAGVQACVPVRGHVAHGVAVRRLEPHDPGAEPEELAARERTGQVPGQVDDEQAFERAILHGFGS